MKVCLKHAMREIGMIGYFDPNKKLAKYVLRLPTKEKKEKCKGSHAYETPCKNWGILEFGLVLKTVARKQIN